MPSLAILCLATAIYFEADRLKLPGQIAVAHVVLNRVESSKYPDDICEVIKDGGEARNLCQFSFYCDGKSDTPENKDLYNKMIWVALFSYIGILPDPTNGATHFHAEWADPYWAQELTFLTKLDRQLFYKE